MGLRINTAVGGLQALQNLQRINRKELDTYERLSTGLRINRASDDPSGLVIYEALRGQLGVISQAVENTQNADNMIQTAEAGLSQVNDLIVQARSLTVQAMNTGVTSPGQLRALQGNLDNIINAIDRVANTTRYSDMPLLNGNMDFNVANASPQLTDIDVTSGVFQGSFPATVNVEVQQAATRAQAGGTIAGVQTGDVKFRVSGLLGSRDIELTDGATQAEVENAVNAVKEYTGVEAAAGVIRSVDYGSDAFVNVAELEGNLDGIAPGRTTGTDILALVNGEKASGDANVLTATGDQLSVRIAVQNGASGSFAFDILGGGATFQLGTSIAAGDRLTMGIPSVNTTNLGSTSEIAALATLRTGAGNDLTDPVNAMKILDAAGKEVSELRGRLGSVSSRIFQSNIRSLDVAFENINASASSIADANLAEEISNMVRNRIVKDSALSALRQTNLTAGMALRLLGQPT